MYDQIETIGNSVIQHGPLNDRIYLMKLNAEDMPQLLDQLDTLADEQGYSKIFAKVTAEHRSLFEEFGYRPEALVPGLYNGRQDALFLGRFLTPDREVDRKLRRTSEILELAARNWGKGRLANGAATAEVVPAAAGDVEEMSQVYCEVFPSYPFPIHDPDYLLQTMKSHVRYFLVRSAGRIAAISSAEMDHEAGNAEMTDFATRPEHRGAGLGSCLLERMELEMDALGIETLYTIARSLSPGMNIVFSRMGYFYAGTLVNNTNISGRIENMNVWYKQKASQPEPAPQS
jgi:putative beta-lysine N-acetyltransferase